MREHENAGEATVEQQREGDFTHGAPAGPYGGTDESAGGAEAPSGTAGAEQVEHVGDGEEGAQEGAQEGDGGEPDGGGAGGEEGHVGEAEGQGDGQGDGELGGGAGESGTSSNSTTSTHIEPNGGNG